MRACSGCSLSFCCLNQAAISFLSLRFFGVMNPLRTQKPTVMINVLKMLLAVVAVLIGFHANAQPPMMLVSNTTSCNLAIDINQADGFCAIAAGASVNLPPFSITPITGAAPSTQWAGARIYNNPICMPFALNLNLLQIANACFASPVSSYYVATAPCNTCQSGIKAEFTSASTIQIW